MTSPEPVPLLSDDRPLTIAILAMGGQGGGVLADWIVALAEAQGWRAQSTSVPGVAQRTGATIYYIEMLPDRTGRNPVLALMPTPGDVDIVLAAEFMEAGRSILRGLVTPERTVLITSTHRSLAVIEKEKPGNGTADSVVVVEAAGVAARRIVAFDMQRLAERHGTVISATLFGALAGAGLLPFPRTAFETAIGTGRAAGPSLAGFAAAFAAVTEPPQAASSDEARAPSAPARTAPPKGLAALLTGLDTTLPASARTLARAGAERLADYLDLAYAGLYAERLAEIRALDDAHGGAARSHALTAAAAKYIAVAMSYDDVFRVADLKTRSERFDRVRREVGAKPEEIVYATEFMHPRMEEVLGCLPARLGAALEARPGLVRRLDRIVNRGRRVRTGTILWFLLLYALAGLGRHRRATLRHAREEAHIAHWLGVVIETVPRDYDLAVEALACRRLVKGYSDTHARGLSKFDRVLATVPDLVGKPDSAAWLRRLVTAALADEAGTNLDGALRTLASAYEAPAPAA